MGWASGGSDPRPVQSRIRVDDDAPAGRQGALLFGNPMPSERGISSLVASTKVGLALGIYLRSRRRIPFSFPLLGTDRHASFLNVHRHAHTDPADSSRFSHGQVLVVALDIADAFPDSNAVVERGPAGSHTWAAGQLVIATQAGCNKGFKRPPVFVVPVQVIGEPNAWGLKLS